MWIFGYGSLIWRPDFVFEERRHALLHGWSRRFFQGSPDHRGTPEAPGRVVTLLKTPEASCWGSIYRLSPQDSEETLAELDVREIAGYEHHFVEVEVFDSGEKTKISDVLMYVAPPENPNFLGEDLLESMAKHILHAHGPSGRNVDYLLKLAESLRAMEAVDEHVFSLEAAVRTLLPSLNEERPRGASR